MITEESFYFSVHAHPAPVFFRFQQILADPTYDQAVLRRGEKGRSFSPLPADFRAIPAKRTPDRRLRQTRNYEPSDFFAMRSQPSAVGFRLLYSCCSSFCDQRAKKPIKAYWPCKLDNGENKNKRNKGFAHNYIYHWSVKMKSTQ